MNTNGILSKNSHLGCIYKCQGGVIHINISGASFHFDQLNFLSFSSMVNEASTKLLNEEMNTLLNENSN